MPASAAVSGLVAVPASPGYNSSVELADLPEVKALSAREKLELVDELWKDVARELETLDVTPEEKQLLDERWADFLRDPSSALTLEQLQERVNTIRR
jgi:putative addiction module component (TIGR02574 family)